MPQEVEVITPPSNEHDPQMDLVKSDFDKLIWQKGYWVTHYQALKCPCKNDKGGQLSNCKNCGGTGWSFVNLMKTKMMLHSMNRDTEFKQWDEELLGTVSITAIEALEVSYMDKIVVEDGNSVFSEALFMKISQSGEFFFNTAYPIKEIKYIGMFKSVNETYTNLYIDTDFVYDDNIIMLDKNKWEGLIPNIDDCSIVVRYSHAPQFHVIDIPRSTMRQVNKRQGGEDNQILPIHAIGRRSHYVLNQQNFTGTRLLDNTKRYTKEELNPST